MNRHDRRQQATVHRLRTAGANGHAVRRPPETDEERTRRLAEATLAPDPSAGSVSPESVPWCVHEERRAQPLYPIGTRVRYLEAGPVPQLRGATGTIVGSAQRLCRLLAPTRWKKLVADPRSNDIANAYHDEPAYWVEHITRADGTTHLDDPILAFPIWVTEAWIEPLIKVAR